jgi:hypothetical protein
MNEIIIVGSRYGELASVVKPLYAMMTPVAQTEIKEKLGGDVVYLSPTDNQFDDDAVGVFTVSQQLLGYVWMCQSYGLKQMLRNSGKRYVKAQISRMNTTFGLLMATSDGSWTLDANVQDNTIDAPTWAIDLPEVLTSMTSQSLTLGLDLLSDELRESAAWSDRLRQRIDNVLRHLPLDLSASHCQECMEVYRQMKQSTIAEVRQHSELLLQTLVSRGSQQQMEWWTEHWLTDFFASAASSDLLRLYEADGWTLERVEELLRKAPERLFQLYLVNKYRFATHLYYSRLSQRAYDRLLTLLAVREAMLAKQGSGPAEKHEAEPEEMFSDDERIIKAVNILKVEGVLKHMYDYTFVMQLMNETEGMPHYDTPQSFLKHFAQLGIAPLPDVSSINRIFSKMVGKFPNWTFVNKDKTETVRRNNVGRRYLNAYKNEK